MEDYMRHISRQGVKYVWNVGKDTGTGIQVYHA